MASDDSLFGSSLDGLPAFFSNESMDDTKYESLLADLRAHDLLGPVESSASTSDAGSSCLFTDAFSAVFPGSFQSSSTGKPGLLNRAPPGLATPSEDQKWARGQEIFSRLEKECQGAPTKPLGAKERADLSLEPDTALDESQVPGLKGLGLDKDDGACVAPASAPPPLPPVPMPPMPPPQAWNTPHGNARPPPQVLPPSPDRLYPPRPPMYTHGRPILPPQGLYPSSSPQYYGRPPMRPPFPSPRGPSGRTPMIPLSPPPMLSHSFKMMTPRDVTFVMQQQMKWLRSSDPFSDDYYFHQYMHKRSRVASPGRTSVPLPSWQLQHVKSVDPRDVQRQVKSRNWENDYHVLGRNTKSSLYRPKQLVSLGGPGGSTAKVADPECTAPSGQGDDQALATAESSREAARLPHVRGGSPGALAVAADAQEAKVLRMSDTASRRSVFANATWTLRLHVDRGLQCLLSLQDARHLLDARGINVQQFHSMRDDAMDPALVELRSRTTALLVELAALLGVHVADVADAADDARRVMRCDLPQLQKMLVASKGKMLVSRALPLLHPSARFVLLPHLIDQLLSGHARNERQSDGDERLCQTLVLLVLYVPPAPPAELFLECLQRALYGHDVPSLARVLHDRARAEAFQALLQRGGLAVQQLTQQTDGIDREHVLRLKQQWAHDQNVFVQLATAMKRAT